MGNPHTFDYADRITCEQKERMHVWRKRKNHREMGLPPVFSGFLVHTCRVCVLLDGSSLSWPFEILIAISAVLSIPFFTYLIWREILVRRLRKAGQYPAKGKATLDDVRRLRDDGRYELALRAYREVVPSTRRKAEESLKTL